LPQWNVETIWLPLIIHWLKIRLPNSQTVHIAIDRTRWQLINVLVISLIWQRRAIPIYLELLPKKGNSNLAEQTSALTKVLPILSAYNVIVLGDREFCSIDLASWLSEKN
jgi:hypothetical protein